MRSDRRVRTCVTRWRLTLAVAIVLAPGVVSAAAQQPSAETRPFQSEWLVIGGAGSSGSAASSPADRDQAFYAIQWGRMLTDERGPGVLRGRLEMLIEMTPVLLAFQSRRAEGAGFSPLMIRWNFLQRRAIHPFFEVAAGVVAMNRDVPEGTTRLNFSTQAGAGTRVQVAGRWSLVAGYRFQHLSNAHTAARNPGINAHVGYMGIAYRR